LGLDLVVESGVGLLLVAEILVSTGWYFEKVFSELFIRFGLIKQA